MVQKNKLDRLIDDTTVYNSMINPICGGKQIGLDSYNVLNIYEIQEFNHFILFLN